ncbi:c94f7fed-8b4b-4c5f-b846-a55e7ddde883 [Thermothielavioides terrestris]|uniref:C94f7fed-8b4b-4c5f-b846-a55e7ddde883 n=1 Tax=Thermothielavioides terrestris TaxID=2587410 RepID=A0A3S4B810_9PEZI|nr:c94f7fed-8b4b-4c5f-b846-a55e7ddde883 [Thermothielavioides terrestris]
MKTLTTLLLSVATLATAAPNAAGPAVLDPRQTCVYSCGCQTDDGSGIDPDTATCCASVGGTLGNDGTLCNGMDLATAQAYARCCGSSGGYVCFQSSSSCPPVTV